MSDLGANQPNHNVNTCRPVTKMYQTLRRAACQEDRDNCHQAMSIANSGTLCKEETHADRSYQLLSGWW